MLFLEIIVFCVEGESCNLWKNSQQGGFRNVRTSVEVENCFAVKLSKSYESAIQKSAKDAEWLPYI